MNYLIKLTALCSLSMVLAVSLAGENSVAESPANESPDAELQSQGVTVNDIAPAKKSSIMDEPLDGSSIESFTAGLEKVDQEATEQEYRSLMSALDFLLFYDVGAKRDKARLYSRLNGKSPTQVLDEVRQIRKGR